MIRTARLSLASFLVMLRLTSHPDAIHAQVGSAIAADSNARVYFIDAIRNRLWKVDPDGHLTTLSVRVRHHDQIALNPKGAVWFVHGFFPSEMRWSLRGVSPDGSFHDVDRPTRIPVFSGSMLAMDDALNIYWVSLTELVRVTPDDSLSVWARPVEMTDARFGILGPDSALYVADSNRVLRVPKSGPEAVLAGSYDAGYADAPGPGARFNRPTGLAVDSGGNVYVADYGNRRLRKISRSGVATTLVEEPWPWIPTGVAVAGGDVYLLERAGDYYGRTLPPFMLIPAVADLLGSPRVRRLAPNGAAVTLVGVRRRGVVLLLLGSLVAGVGLVGWRVKRSRS